MNSKAKRRMAVVTGIIVIVLILVLAIVGGNTAARTVSVAEALEIQDDAKIQVTGNVAENSFEIDGDVLTFKIYDTEADPAGTNLLDVRYDGGVSATFGNDVTAICTGKKTADGVLNCSELVTKCPSKYENAEGSLSISDLLGYGESVLDKPVKVSGVMKAGTLAGVDASERFVIIDNETNDKLHVVYEGALSDDTAEGSSVVLTGSIGKSGLFTATNVALEG
ncbi:MAG: cytochrome c maturation protein CcmE [Eggerthellaceae bacterium]|nr:cytochrome c maturation protein CcmE [Eggerthellaceae bacterium]